MCKVNGIFRLNHRDTECDNIRFFKTINTTLDERGNEREERETENKSKNLIDILTFNDFEAMKGE